MSTGSKKLLGIKSVKKIDDWYWTLNPDAEYTAFNDYSPSESVDETDETPFLFLDEMSSLTQLSVEPEQGILQRGISSGSTKDNQSITKTMSPYGELELLDWRARVT